MTSCRQAQAWHGSDGWQNSLAHVTVLIASASELSARLARVSACSGLSEVRSSIINTFRSGVVRVSSRAWSSSRQVGTKSSSFDIFLNAVMVTTLDVEVIHHASFNWEMEQKNVFLSTYPGCTRSNDSAEQTRSAIRMPSKYLLMMCKSESAGAAGWTRLMVKRQQKEQPLSGGRAGAERVWKEKQEQQAGRGSDTSYGSCLVPKVRGLAWSP